MEKVLIVAGVLIALAVATPPFLSARLAERAPKAENATPRATSAPRKVVRSGEALLYAGRKARIAADGNGHFVTEARLNGVRRKVIIDTGATHVALNETTARRLGIRLRNADFKYRVKTANGIAEAAKAAVDRLEIGRIRLENVTASIARDEALDVVLIGMSFLSRLERFEIENGELILTQ